MHVDIKKLKTLWFKNPTLKCIFCRKYRRKSYIHGHVTYHSEKWKHTSKCPATVKLGGNTSVSQNYSSWELSAHEAVSWANVKLTEKPTEGAQLNGVAVTAVQCGKRLKWMLWSGRNGAVGVKFKEVLFSMSAFHIFRWHSYITF